MLIILKFVIKNIITIIVKLHNIDNDMKKFTILCEVMPDSIFILIREIELNDRIACNIGIMKIKYEYSLKLLESKILDKYRERSNEQPETNPIILACR